jgi:hypothetical protein
MRAEASKFRTITEFFSVPNKCERINVGAIAAANRRLRKDHGYVGGDIDMDSNMTSDTDGTDNELSDSSFGEVSEEGSAMDEDTD